MDNSLDALGGAKYFSSLDLASGCWQVMLSDNSSLKSAFTTYCGLFEFVRMPFGLCNALATFQCVIQWVLAGLEGCSCFVYLDDVLIASQTFSDHLQHLRKVLTRLRSAGLCLKPRKCHLLQREVLFLGHVIAANSVCPDPAKTEMDQHYPPPTDVTKVQQFGILQTFYPCLLLYCIPLTCLTCLDQEGCSLLSGAG